MRSFRLTELRTKKHTTLSLKAATHFSNHNLLQVTDKSMTKQECTLFNKVSVPLINNQKNIKIFIKFEKL